MLSQYRISAFVNFCGGGSLVCAALAAKILAAVLSLLIFRSPTKSPHKAVKKGRKTVIAIK
nr:MAG TPA: hypothetical protein [Caudoviricetes sp.]